MYLNLAKDKWIPMPKHPESLQLYDNIIERYAEAEE